MSVAVFSCIYKALGSQINTTNCNLRFDEKESVSGVQQLKSSVQKGIRTKLLEQFPHIEQYVDVILPKKDAFKIVKWQVLLTLHGMM